MRIYHVQRLILAFIIPSSRAWSVLGTISIRGTGPLRMISTLYRAIQGLCPSPNRSLSLSLSLSLSYNMAVSKSWFWSNWYNINAGIGVFALSIVAAYWNHFDLVQRCISPISAS